MNRVKAKWIDCSWYLSLQWHNFCLRLHFCFTWTQHFFHIPNTIQCYNLIACMCWSIRLHGKLTCHRIAMLMRHRNKGHWFICLVEMLHWWDFHNLPIGTTCWWYFHFFCFFHYFCCYFRLFPIPNVIPIAHIIFLTKKTNVIILTKWTVLMIICTYVFVCSFAAHEQRLLFCFAFPSLWNSFLIHVVLNIPKMRLKIMFIGEMGMYVRKCACM